LKIAYLILNSFDIDSRARLEVETLKTAGHEIDIIATTGGSSDDFLGCRIHRIKQRTWPSRKIRFIQYNMQAARIGAGLKADVYHAVDLDTLYPACKAAELNRSKIVYESRELYTELEALRGRKFITSFWRSLEARLIGRADSVITINDSIADELAARYRIPKPGIIRNVAVRADSLEPVDLRKELNIPSDHRIIVYQGVLRKGQGLTYLLRIVDVMSKVSLVFLGDGPLREELVMQANYLGLDDIVRFPGRIPPDQLLNFTAGADAGVLLMEDVALNNRLALPQKVFQYMAAGIPQIVSPMPEIAKLVSSEKIGITVTLDNPAESADDIERFLNDSIQYSEARDNSKSAIEKYNWQKESKELLRIYEGLGGDT